MNDSSRYDAYDEEYRQKIMERREKRRRLEMLRRRRRRRNLLFCALMVLIVILILLLRSCGGKKTSSKVEVSQAEKEAAEVRIEQMVKGYFYEEALSYIESCGCFTKSEQDEKKQALEEAHIEPVLYTGDVPHIFFHCLIVYPELAFDGEYTQEGYDAWMVTTEEFKAMLQELYDRDFILIRMRDLYMDNGDGTISQAPLYLPPGKTPLVISLDDVCYYPYMKGDGFASKLVVSGDAVRTEIETPDGQTIVTATGDAIPLIDSFVRLHPDFSWRGAKGVIAVTGYEGLLGYRVSDEEDLTHAANEKAAVIPVLQKLYETGWEMASHSFTHNDYFKDYSITDEQMQYDSNKWDRLIGSVIREVYGKVENFISPFGVSYQDDDSRFQYLMNSFDFKVYCPVDSNTYLRFTDRYMIMNRCAIDGVSLRTNKERLSRFFDCDAVYDHRRPE